MAVFMEVFYHLVLPPKLPGKQDANIESTGDAIVDRLIRAAFTLSQLAGQKDASPWYAILLHLRRYQSLHVHGRLERLSLISKFRDFNQEHPLILHVAEQNAALIIRYNGRYVCCSRPSTYHESCS
jgi:hypothetical protein